MIHFQSLTTSSKRGWCKDNNDDEDGDKDDVDVEADIEKSVEILSKSWRWEGWRAGEGWSGRTERFLNILIVIIFLHWTWIFGRSTRFKLVIQNLWVRLRRNNNLWKQTKCFSEIGGSYRVVQSGKWLNKAIQGCLLGTACKCIRNTRRKSAKRVNTMRNRWALHLDPT